jgi:hypothetical protein
VTVLRRLTYGMDAADVSTWLRPGKSLFRTTKPWKLCIEDGNRFGHGLSG